MTTTTKRTAINAVRWLGAFGHSKSLEASISFELSSDIDCCSVLVRSNDTVPQAGKACVGLRIESCTNVQYHKADAYTVLGEDGMLEKTRQDVASTKDCVIAQFWADGQDEYVEVNSHGNAYSALVIHESILKETETRLRQVLYVEPVLKTVFSKSFDSREDAIEFAESCGAYEYKINELKINGKANSKFNAVMQIAVGDKDVCKYTSMRELSIPDYIKELSKEFNLPIEIVK